MVLSKPANRFPNYCSDEQRRAVLTAVGHKGKKGRSTLLKGCAGSRKTETLIMIGLLNYFAGRRVVFVTLVTSVTVEIMVRITANLIGSWFEKTGNHYVMQGGPGGKRTGSIQVSNLDAVIHARLLSEDIDMGDIGDQFGEKARLITSMGLKNVIMVDGGVADVILWDEIQDSHPSRAMALAQLVEGTPALAHAAGDLMQTIFDAALKGGLHPMNLFARALQSTVVQQTVCWRCPESHIRFRNRIMSDFDKQHGCFPLVASPTPPDGWRPILLPHGPLTGEKGNFNAAVVADIVFNCILFLLHHDPSLRLSDFAILMPRSNDNAVFNQLEERLNKHFGPRSAIILRSKVNGDRQGINWELAKTLNAVRLLSIHADKGLGHKAVFCLGITENSLPQQHRLFHSGELVDQSLLNVALTRSKAYLFVGMASGAPSRYICDNIGSLITDNLVAAVWDEKTWGAERGVCEVIAARVIDMKPNFANRHYLQRPIRRPSKLVLNLAQDVADTVDHPKDLMRFRWTTPEKESFGSKPWLIPPDIHQQEDLLMPVVGYMAELLLKRHIYAPSVRPCEYRLESSVINRTDIRYTSDGMQLDLVADLSLNELALAGGDNVRALWEEPLRSHGKSLRGRPRLCPFRKAVQRMLREGPAIILDSKFKKATFRESLAAYLDCDDVRTLKGRQLWNVALLHASSRGFRRAHVLSFMDYFQGDIGDLVENVVAFAQLPVMCDPTVSLQVPLNILHCESNPDVMKEMGLTRPALVGLRGIADCVSESSLFEFKASRQKDCPNEWKFQVFAGACLRPGVEHIRVVNLALGRMYSWRLPDTFHSKEKYEALAKLFRAADFRDEHVTSLVALAS
jgi:hypothetical protein